MELYSSLILGFGTGTYKTIAAFLGTWLTYFATLFAPHQRNSSQQTYFTICHYLALNTDFHSRALTILLCHRFIYAILGGIGISTDCPSSTPFGLDLGPDLPWADEPSPGILRLSTGRILTSLSLLMPAFSLVYCPPPLPVRLLPVYIAPLPMQYSASPCFGDRF